MIALDIEYGHTKTKNGWEVIFDIKGIFLKESC